MARIFSQVEEISKSFRESRKTYFRSSELRNFLAKAKNIIPHLPGFFRTWFLPFAQRTQIQNFRSILENPDKLRSSINQAFILKQKSDLVNSEDDLNFEYLDNQQFQSVLVDDDRNLVVAGAGSGKTTVIAAKVAYLIKNSGVAPDQVLLISFTKDASKNMSKKIKKQYDIEVDSCTLHSLAYQIVKSVENTNPKIAFSGKDSSLLTDTLEGFIEKEFKCLLQNPSYKRFVKKYFSWFLKPYKPIHDFSSKEEHIKFLKETRSYETLNGIRVKSHEEKRVGDFLFLNGVKYVYERGYPEKVSSPGYSAYKPDFYLPDFDVYLEHLALNKANEAPSWFKVYSCNLDGGPACQTPTECYLKRLKWKQEIHKQFGTKLVESYSWELQEEDWENCLIKKLENAGVVLKPISVDEALQRFLKKRSRFTNKAATFLQLLDNSSMGLREVRNKVHAFSNKNNRQRGLGFLELFKPIYSRYVDTLKKTKQTSFAGLIKKATDYCQTGSWTPTYSYIVVDEFQDTSASVLQFLKALLDKSPADTSLFCVGDDWQSIYRFNGADLSSFLRFGGHFGEYTKVLLENNYRSCQGIVDVASEFIQKNPEQERKQVFAKCSDDNQNPFLFVNQDNLFEIIQRLIEDGNFETLFFLGRYNADIRNPFVQQLKKDLDQAIKTSIYTIHKSKGLEADVVVLLDSLQGFPSPSMDDPVLEILKGEPESFSFAEERRLMYVAITRAKTKFIVVEGKGGSSVFVTELKRLITKRWGAITNPDGELEKYCPECKGVLKKRENRSGRPFWGCENYSLGCRYSRSINRTFSCNRGVEEQEAHKGL